jgi:hypothetical protein
MVRRKLLDISLLIPKVVPGRPFLLIFFSLSKIIMIVLRDAAGIIAGVFPHLEPESSVCVGAGLQDWFILGLGDHPFPKKVPCIAYEDLRGFLVPWESG